MPVPDFQSLMLPMLQIAADGKEYRIQDFAEILAKRLSLSESDISEILPSGKQTRFSNRVGWAKTHLVKAGLLATLRRPYCMITQRGLDVLKDPPEKIDLKFLKRFPEFIEFRNTHRAKGEEEWDQNESVKESPDRTPEEILEDAYEEIRSNLAADLLENVKACSPKFFEQLVVELLVNMGYGGSRREAARAVGQSGDGGIDGIIDEDRLGLDTIYIQAKRWADGTVGRPEIQKFAGALMGKKANKGIFITTSTFTKDAREYAEAINSKIILIDGKRLAELMIDYDIGVTNVNSYHLKRIDSDYFGDGA